MTYCEWRINHQRCLDKQLSDLPHPPTQTTLQLRMMKEGMDTMKHVICTSGKERREVKSIPPEGRKHLKSRIQKDHLKVESHRGKNGGSHLQSQCSEDKDRSMGSRPASVTEDSVSKEQVEKSSDGSFMSLVST